MSCSRPWLLGGVWRVVTLIGEDAKSRTRPCCCRKSIPRITGLISESTTTSGCSTLSCPTCTTTLACPTTGIGSPAAETNCKSPGLSCFTPNVLGRILFRTKEMIEPESSKMSTSMSPSLPLRTAALGCTAATTTLDTLGGLTCARGVPGPDGTPLSRFPTDNPWLCVQGDHTQSIPLTLGTAVEDVLADGSDSTAGAC